MPDVIDQFGGREILRELSAGRSWAARDRGGREVVIKLLESDCLLGDKLHLSIRERLERVRELPQKDIANLHGVERDGGMTYLVWDFISGEPILDAAERGHEADRKRLARELVLSVQSLHLAGIVHGRIHAGNVLVDRDANVRLIDVSPLLWGDEQVDVQGVMALVEELLETQLNIDADRATLDEVLGAIDDGPAIECEHGTYEKRWGMVIAAVALLFLGILVAVSIHRLVSGEAAADATPTTSHE